MEYAPILIPTLCRFEHFKKCFDSLARNSLAKESIIYIALDFPIKEKYKEGYNDILNYLTNESQKQLFKQVILLKREHNFGAYINGVEGVKELFKKYDRVIFTEDDNEFSPNFLDYVNKGLIKFENNEQVRAICSYSQDFITNKEFRDNYFLSHRFDAWGIGLWKSKPIPNEIDPDSIKKYLSNKSNFRYFKKKCIPKYFYYDVLWSILRKRSITYDKAAFLTNIINKTYSVFPVVSKSRNLGFDGSGGSDNNRTYVKKLDNLHLNKKIEEKENFDFEGTNSLDSDFTYLNLNLHKLNLRKVIKVFFVKIYFVFYYLRSK